MFSDQLETRFLVFVSNSVVSSAIGSHHVLGEPRKMTITHVSLIMHKINSKRIMDLSTRKDAIKLLEEKSKEMASSYRRK